MVQDHCISKVSLHFRAPRQADGFTLQTEVSDWFWQDVLPELNRTLDEVIPPEVVVRLDQITIELPDISLVNWKEKLTESVCRLIAEEITRRRLFPRPTDVPAEEVSSTENGFAAWMEFLRTGHRRVSVTAPTEWATNALSLIAASPIALSAFRQLLQTQPPALERLVRQYDEEFLGQLVEAMTGQPAAELHRWKAAYQGLLAATWWKVVFGTAPSNGKEPKRVFWLLIFQRLSAGDQPQVLHQRVSSSGFFSAFVNQVLHRPSGAGHPLLAIILFFQNKHRKAEKRRMHGLQPRSPEWAAFSEARLLTKIRTSLQDLPENNLLTGLFEHILREERSLVQNLLRQQNQTTETTAINLKPSELKKPSTSGDSKEGDEQVTVPGKGIKERHIREVAEGGAQEDLANCNQPPDVETLSDFKWLEEPAGSLETIAERNEELRPSEVPEGEVFYVANAGVVLLHPFLTAYFEELGLQPDHQPDRARAVQLIHFLVTGESQTPEYDLLLPKLLAGWPIDMPVDGELDLTGKEIAEAESLIKQVIDYWGALGSTSPDGLREGFLQRDGRLSKRSDGWLLQVETKTLDILLGQLPWGLGVIKHAWMTEFLYVEWC